MNFEGEGYVINPLCELTLKNLYQKVAPIIPEPNSIACWTTALPLCWRELPWYSQRFSIWLSKHNNFINNNKKVLWAEYTRTREKKTQYAHTRNKTMPLLNNKSRFKNIYTLLASPSQEKKTSFKTVNQNSLSSHNISLESRTNSLCNVGNMLQDWRNQPPVNS